MIYPSSQPHIEEAAKEYEAARDELISHANDPVAWEQSRKDLDGKLDSLTHRIGRWRIGSWYFSAETGCRYQVDLVGELYREVLTQLPKGVRRPKPATPATA